MIKNVSRIIFKLYKIIIIKKSIQLVIIYMTNLNPHENAIIRDVEKINAKKLFYNATIKGLKDIFTN